MSLPRSFRPVLFLLFCICNIVTIRVHGCWGVGCHMPVIQGGKRENKRDGVGGQNNVKKMMSRIAFTPSHQLMTLFSHILSTYTVKLVLHHWCHSPLARPTLCPFLSWFSYVLTTRICLIRPIHPSSFWGKTVLNIATVTSPIWNYLHHCAHTRGIGRICGGTKMYERNTEQIG